MARPETKGRMLNRDVSDSHGIAALSPEAAVLFFMIIPHLNSYGKLNGGAGYIKDLVCPFVQYITFNKIPSLMVEISQKTNMKYWCQDSRCWIHAIHFLTDHQNLRPERMGSDSLPQWPGIVDENLSPVLSPVPSPQKLNISQAQVPPEVEVEVEVKEEVEGEEEVKACMHAETFTARQIRECVKSNRALLSEKYPGVDIDLEAEEMVAKYRNQSIGADPGLLVLRWFKNLRSRDRPSNAEQVREGNHYAAREFVDG
jgi:hypothetical protein